jgi:hypothetical protein
MDICYGVQILTEIGLDYGSKWSFAQSDVRQYYNSIEPIAIVSGLVAMGACPEVSKACLRLRMMPRVSLRHDGIERSLNERVVGLMTGCRTAAVLAIVPVWDTFMGNVALLNSCSIPFTAAGLKNLARGYGATVEEGSLPQPLTFHNSISVATWADNIFTMSSDAEGAVRVMEAVEVSLEQRWRLSIKHGSKELMQLKNSPHILLPEGWKHVDCMSALGHNMSNDARPQKCIVASLGSAWSGYWRQFSMSIRGMGGAPKGRLFERAVTPIVRYRAARWPWTKSLEDQICKHQRRMLACTARLRLQTGED